jgi:N-acetylglucosaminyl-diphospho-decaprenol L-rhamnosyltransferase
MIAPDRSIVPSKVTVSVVSHRQAHLALTLLADLNRHCSNAIAQVVLTCNLPEVLTIDPNQYQFPIEIIVNPAPTGFGANHNQAFQRRLCEWFLVINPDVRLTADVISALMLRATNATGLLAPQELNESGCRVDNLRGPITPWELVRRQLLKKPPPPPARCGWVKGMFMLTRSKAFQAVGGFDSRYYMYCEDFDLCARLMLAGWTVDYHADLVVTHSWRRESHDSRSHLKNHLQSLFKMWASSAFWRYRKHLNIRFR